MLEDEQRARVVLRQFRGPPEWNVEPQAAADLRDLVIVGGQNGASETLGGECRFGGVRQQRLAGEKVGRFSVGDPALFEDLDGLFE